MGGGGARWGQEDSHLHACTPRPFMCVLLCVFIFYSLFYCGILRPFTRIFFSIQIIQSRIVLDGKQGVQIEPYLMDIGDEIYHSEILSAVYFDEEITLL